MFFTIIAAYLAAVNIAAYFLIRADKKYAVNKEWRIEEVVLLTVCCIGGFMGTHLAMERYRHKTQHWIFRVAVMLSAVIFLVVLPMIFFIRMSK